MMRWIAGFALVLVLGCSHRAVPTDGSLATDRGPLPDGLPDLCSCLDPVSGTVNGKAVSYPYSDWGVQVTWGSHASPVSPEQVVGLELVLTDDPSFCTQTEPKEPGPMLMLDTTVGMVQKPFVFGWRLDSGTWVDGQGQVCLTASAVSIGDPVGWPPNVSGSVSGCVKLSLTVEDKPAGQIQGGFRAQHCGRLDGAMGE